MQLPPYQRRREGDVASLLPPSRPGSTEFNRAWDCIYTHLYLLPTVPSKLKLSQESTWALPSRPCPVLLAGYCAGKTEGLAKKGSVGLGPQALWDPGPLGLQLPRGLCDGRHVFAWKEGDASCVIGARGRRRGMITYRPGPGLSVTTRPGPGRGARGARGAGAAMAAVFDLDLETEEGSEGEGEPEFSPAVSGPLGRSSIPEPCPSPWR